MKKKYLLLNNGVEYIVRAHRKKLNISSVNVGHMKRLVSTSKNFVLLMIKKQNDIDYESFEGCDEKLKFDLFDVVSKHSEIFQEPKGLPPKRGIQHEIQLQQDVPLPYWQVSHVDYEELGNQEENSRTNEQRYHTPIYFAMWFAHCFGTKEGRDLVHVCGFSCTE